MRTEWRTSKKEEKTNEKKLKFNTSSLKINDGLTQNSTQTDGIRLPFLQPFPPSPLTVLM